MNWFFVVIVLVFLTWEWRPESSSCPLGFVTFSCDFWPPNCVCAIVFRELLFIIFSRCWFVLVLSFLWNLFGCDDAPSSDVPAHQVIWFNSTRASRFKQFFILGNFSSSYSWSEFPGGRTRLGPWFLGNSFSSMLWLPMQILGTNHEALVKISLIFGSLFFLFAALCSCSPALTLSFGCVLRRADPPTGSLFIVKVEQQELRSCSQAPS